MEAYSDVASLKQDLELILSSPPASNSTNEDFHSIRERVKLMDGLLRNTIRKTDEEFQTLSNKVNWKKWSHSNTVEEMNDEFDTLGNIANLVGWLRENAIGENCLPGRMRDLVDNLKKKLWILLCKDKIEEPRYNIWLVEVLLRDSLEENYMKSEVRKLVDCMKHYDSCIRGDVFQKLCSKVCLMESFLLDTPNKKYYYLENEIKVVYKKYYHKGHIPWEIYHQQISKPLSCNKRFQKHYYKIWLIEWLLMYSMGKRYLDSEIRAVLNSMKRILKDSLIHFNKLQKLYDMVYWMEDQAIYYRVSIMISQHSYSTAMMEVLYFFKLVVNDCEPLIGSELVQKFHDEACSMELLLTDADSSMIRKPLVSMLKILMPFLRDINYSMESLLRDINYPGLLLEMEKSQFQKLYEKALLMRSLLTDSFVRQFFQSHVIKEMVHFYMECIEKDRQPIKLFPEHEELDCLIYSLFSYSFEENYFQTETVEESLLSQEDVVASITTDLEELESLIRKTQLPTLYRDICSHSNQHLSNSNFQCCIGFVNSTKEDILKYLKKPLHFSDTFKKIIPYICLLEYFISCKSSNLCYQVQDWILISENYLCKEVERLIYKEFERLHDNVGMMELLLGDSLGKNCNQLNILSVSEIQDVAQRASYYINYKNRQEVFIELEESDRLTLAKESEAFGLSSNHTMTSLLKVREEIVSINQKLKIILFNAKRKVLGTKILQTSQNPASTTGSSSTLLKPLPRSQNNNVKLVGHDKELEAMLDCLTGQSLALKVFPLIGMAGIGKTTFANELYDHPLVVEKFDIRAWVTVSQEYHLRGLLLGLISCVTNLSDEIHERSDEQLQEQLHKTLKGRKYLIVLDDVWDKHVWDDMRRYFPMDNNGSRILLTSRLLDMATYASEGVPPHYVRLLNLEESKKLLCSKIFADESYPKELLAIGEKIVDKCHGLPLAIVVVGGLLAKKRRETKDWEEVAENVGSLVMEGPQCCEKILSLSYSHLSEPLKACFLYMGVFPKDFEITSKRLKYLWIAEGFVLTEEQKALEQVAEVYLKDLIDRSLIMVKQKSSGGGIKICHIHDLMRDLCVKESQKQNFLHVRTEKCTESQENELYNSRRIAIHSHLSIYLKKGASFPFAHSFFCFEALRPTDLKGYSGMYFMLLKILDIAQVHLLSLPPGVLLLRNLKYLALTIKNSIVLLELSKLCNLQTCIIDGEWSGDLCREFWDMTNIRHFYVKWRSYQTPNEDYFTTSNLRILENVQSLLTICPKSCTKEILLSMPNLKKLGVYEIENDYLSRGWFKNLECLEHLETLKYAFSNPFSRVKPERFPLWSMFPPNLMKLTLSGTSFPWEDMDKLSMLPKLEVLKLKNYAFCGSHWDMGENCFRHLKYLQIGSTNLEEWFVDESHFPMLQHLVLRHCRSLKDIPYDIGNAPSLEKIELHCCSESAVTSARGLHEEQIEMGNLCLRVYITKR